ncbi:MAG: chalcone isomerase family protein [Planctomycetes bacterium]|nr:chalcone isomerase family protein [Planctomycetota bacterium]
MPRLLTVAALATLLCAAPRIGSAAQIDGQDFADTLTADGQPFALHGVGHLIYRAFFTAYCSALYLAPGGAVADVLKDVPKRLELHYFYAIDAGDFVKATNATIGDNISAATLAAIRPQVDALNKLYVDIKAGDRYALTYVPKTGTELSRNGTALGTVPGADFAQALFAIWVGEKNIDARLRTSLLTKAAPAKP